MIGCLIMGSKKTLLITTLNVMGAFFVFLYVSMDINMGNLTWESPVTHTNIIFLGKRVIYHGKIVP